MGVRWARDGAGKRQFCVTGNSNACHACASTQCGGRGRDTTRMERDRTCAFFGRAPRAKTLCTPTLPKQTQARAPNATVVAANLDRLKHNASALADAKARVSAVAAIEAAQAERGVLVKALTLKRALNASAWHNATKAGVDTRLRALAAVKKADALEWAAWADAVLNTVDPPPTYGVRVTVVSGGDGGGRLAQVLTEAGVCSAVWWLQEPVVACVGDVAPGGGSAAVTVWYATRDAPEGLVTKLQTVAALRAAGQLAPGDDAGALATGVATVTTAPDDIIIVPPPSSYTPPPPPPPTPPPPPPPPPIIYTESEWLLCPNASPRVTLLFEGAVASLACPVTTVTLYYGYTGSSTVYKKSVPATTETAELAEVFSNTQTRRATRLCLRLASAPTDGRRSRRPCGTCTSRT